MPDKFASYSDAPFSPARSFFNITPSDSTDYLMGAGLKVPKALRIGVAGTLVVVGVEDSASTTMTVNAGDIIPGMVRQVLATGTTAANIVGLA